MIKSVSHAATNHSSRGLATIAYLKTRFNEGVDHLAMFEPFVEAAIDGFARDDLEISDVGEWIKKTTGLSIPGEILKSLLGRSAKKGAARTTRRAVLSNQWPSCQRRRRAGRLAGHGSGAKTPRSGFARVQ